MLHCNMKVEWQCCHALKLGSPEPKLQIPDVTCFLHVRRCPLRLKTLLELVQLGRVVDLDRGCASDE